MRGKGGGSYYRRGDVFWIKYYRNGKPHRESTGSNLERVAKDLLNKRMGAISAGLPISLKAERIKVDELLDDLLTEYRVNERASLPRMEQLVGHLRGYFSGARAMSVDTATVRSYIDARQQAGAANATINRELAALKRAYSLAIKATPPKVTTKPHIPGLAENNVRKGFFEPEQFEGVLRHLPEDVRPVVTFGYITGWRLAEVLGLTWKQAVGL